MEIGENMYLKRDIYKEIFKHQKVRQITVITGMRRTGKTTLLKELLNKCSSQNKVYLDLERLDNRELLSEKNYDNIIHGLSQLGLNLDEKIYFFIDEIQLVKNIPSVVKYLYDNYDIKFTLTGSSSYYLKNMFTESLAGRKKIFELKTLLFSEYLVFNNFPIKKANSNFNYFSNYEYEKLYKYYEEYLKFGGFPEVVLTKNVEEKVDILNDIIDSYIRIDIPSMSEFRNTSKLKKLLSLLAKRVASKIIVTKLSSVSQISRPTLNEYLQFLEDTFVIKRINVFSNNPDREISKAQKLYFTDNGILNILGNTSGGAEFENSIFNQLSNYGELKYYSLKNGKEIDFILNNSAFEAKETPDNYDLKNVNRLAEKIGIDKVFLIGRNKSDYFHNYIWGGSI